MYKMLNNYKIKAVNRLLVVLDFNFVQALAQRVFKNIIHTNSVCL